MRFKNDGPITLYVVMNIEYGNVMRTFTNLATARAFVRDQSKFDDLGYKVLTYDQRGTR